MARLGASRADTYKRIRQRKRPTQIPPRVSGSAGGNASNSDGRRRPTGQESGGKLWGDGDGGLERRSDLDGSEDGAAAE
jgi:hypothetical protein